MPSRAFLLFGPGRHLKGGHNANFVSMPSRAFLLFGRFAAEMGLRAYASFNALAGIFAFRTCGMSPIKGLTDRFQCPRGHFCFSD